MEDEQTVFQPRPEAIRPGVRLNGIYEIERLVAEGGMGQVYRAFNVQTRDPVAIKMIRAELSGDGAVIALFRREASTLFNLHHEAIVRYFVFSVDPGLQRAYLAMEFVEGPSLATRVADRPLNVPEAFILLQRIGDALDKAHGVGVIHRDLSPDNIILPDGDARKAKLIDFGIARSLTSNERTIVGDGFAGKMNYVSPEQLGLGGGEVTGKSDIYSFGLVIAGAVGGRALDMSGTQLQILEKRRRLPDLSGLPPELAPALRAMLQPDPRDRPGSMSEVANRLAVGAVVARSRARSRNREAAAVAALLIAGAGGLGLIFRDDIAKRLGSGPAVAVSTPAAKPAETVPSAVAASASPQPQAAPSASVVEAPRPAVSPSPTQPAVLARPAEPPAPVAVVEAPLPRPSAAPAPSAPAPVVAAKPVEAAPSVEVSPSTSAVAETPGPRPSPAPAPSAPATVVAAKPVEPAPSVEVSPSPTVVAEPSSPRPSPVPAQTPTAQVALSKPVEAPPPPTLSAAPTPTPTAQAALTKPAPPSEPNALASPAPRAPATPEASPSPTSAAPESPPAKVVEASSTPSAIEVSAPSATPTIVAALPAAPTHVPGPAELLEAKPPGAPSAAFDLPTGIVGKAYRATTPAFSDPGGKGLSLTAQGLPEGLTFADRGGGVGEVSGAPAHDGAQTFIVTAANRGGRTAQMVASINVFEPVRAPEPTQSSVVLAAAMVGRDYHAALPAFNAGSDPSGLALKVDPELPDGLVFADRGSGAAELSGRPTRPGSYEFDVLSRDSYGPGGRMRVDLTIAPEPTPTAVATPRAPMPSQPMVLLADAIAGKPYDAALPPFRVGADPRGLRLSVDPAPPEGMTFADAGGGLSLLSGQPARAGVYAFDVVSHDANGSGGRMAVKLTVAPAPVVAKAPQPAVTTAMLDPLLKTRAFLKTYDGGGCYFASAPDGSPNNVEALAADVATVKKFEAAFQQELGADPNITLRLISPAQCPLIELMRLSAAGDAAPPTLQLAAAAVGPGHPLTGRVTGLAGRHLQLVIFDNEGDALPLKSVVEADGDAAVFEASLKGDAASAGKTQLITAIVSTAPFAAFSGPRQPNAAGLVGALRGEWSGANAVASTGFFRLTK